MKMTRETKMKREERQRRGKKVGVPTYDDRLEALFLILWVAHSRSQFVD